MFRSLWSRLRGSLRRDDAAERDMDQEMRFHLEMATRRNIVRGMTPEEAKRRAKLSFGSDEMFKEEGREAYRARVAEDLVGDVRFALRGLRKAPSFAAAAILTVALGIGASTAIFSVVNAALLRPLPIPHPEDYAYVGWVWGKGGDSPALSAFQYEFVRDHGRMFDAVATYHETEADLGDPATATSARGLRVSSGFFRTMGFEPRLGRTFDARELGEGGPAVVILGDGVWRTRFAADPAVLGHQILLNGDPYTVIGVLGPEFRFPRSPDNTGFLVPFPVRADPVDEGHNSDVIVRLRHGLSEVQRSAGLREMTEAFRTAYPSLAAADESFRLYTHAEVTVGRARTTLLWVLLGAVSLLLLIACANTATLQLVRASMRQREIAVRASIGAGPARIAQQLLVEGLVLSFMGATLGVLLSVFAVRSFLAVAPTALPSGVHPGLDGRVLIYVTAISIVTGLVFGLAATAPAFGTRLQSALQGGSRGSTAGGMRLREALVFLETTAAVVLLSGAALLIASFARLISVDPGFDADHAIAMQLGRFPAGYDAPRREQLVNDLLERIRALPGVEAAAVTPNLPLERGLNFPVDTPDHPELGMGAVELRFVSSGYLAALGIPLRAGRDFRASDYVDTEPVAIVNEAFVKHFWGGAASLGNTIQIGHFKDRWLALGLDHGTRVVGVAADIREVGLATAPKPTVLVPRAQFAAGMSMLAQFKGDSPFFLVRTSARGIPQSLRDQVTAVEPRLSPEVERLSTVVHRSVAEPRFRALIVGAFAGFALLLAGVGIYGVVSAVVERRRREIGLRLALGASRGRVVAVVARRCLATVAWGAVAGLLVYWAARRVISSMLYDMSAGDPWVLGIAVAVLAVVAALACWIPARRAAGATPAASLRLD